MLEGLAVGPRNTLSSGQVGGHVLTNLSLRAPNFRAGVDLELGCYNHFDVRYSDPAGADLLQDSIEQEGRRIALRLRIRR